MVNLYVIATPLGNLGDITVRALETLKRVDLVLCEDTRRTLNMLSVYEISKPLLSYHHSKEGKDLVMAFDAATPGMADPGGSLIEAIRNSFGNSVNVIPIPGPSALAAAASVSGFPVDRFLFLRTRGLNFLTKWQLSITQLFSMNRLIA